MKCSLQLSIRFLKNVAFFSFLLYYLTTIFVSCCTLQTKSAKALAKLLELCMVRDPCPNPKIIKNLCAFACSDPAVTPNVNLNVAVTTEEPPPSPSPSPCPSPSPSPSPSPGGCQSESNCNSVASNTSTSLERSNTVACDQYNGILLLVQQQKVCLTSRNRKKGFWYQIKDSKRCTSILSCMLFFLAFFFAT